MWSATDIYAGLLALQPAEVVTSDVSVSAFPGQAARRASFSFASEVLGGLALLREEPRTTTVARRAYEKRVVVKNKYTHIYVYFFQANTLPTDIVKVGLIFLGGIILNIQGH